MTLFLSVDEIPAVSDANQAITDPFAVAAPSSSRDTTLPARKPPRAIPVAGVDRLIEVKIASEMDEWEQAFRLVSAKYQAIGAEPLSPDNLRVTPHHALPDTTSFVAKHEGRVIGTLGLVIDNDLLGLPADSLYGNEINELRRQGRRVVEVSSFADRGLSVREFIPVFVTLARLMIHYAIKQGADVMVITCRPRHAQFYRKVLGFQPFGPRRAYAAVMNYPTEALLLDVPPVRENAPKYYQTIVEATPPTEALKCRAMPTHMVRLFAKRAGQADPRYINEILDHVRLFGSPRRWR